MHLRIWTFAILISFIPAPLLAQNDYSLGGASIKVIDDVRVRLWGITV